MVVSLGTYISNKVEFGELLQTLVT